MRRAVLGLVLAFCAGAAWAQTVEVRAGEHDSFTRLVFNLPARMGYDLSRGKGQARLTFGRAGLALDTSAVFQRVPKTRLTGISQAPDRKMVTLALACDCAIDTFWFARASLVVDIRDAPAPAVEEVSVAPAPDGGGIVLAPIAVPDARSTAAVRLMTAALDRQIAAAPPAVPVVATRIGAEALTESRARLFKEFGRAASQGLLSPRTTLPEQPTPEVAVARAAPAEAPPQQPGRRRHNIHLQAETSVDRDMQAIMANGLGPAAAETCLAPRLVDVAAWGEDAPFSQQIAPLRARLVGEFDKPDARTVTSLARLYIYFGFGAEARRILEQFPKAERGDAVLKDLAAIVETGDAGPGSALAGQMDCDPRTALWSALSYPALPANQPLDADAILRGFSALPAHLRTHLGPVLARRFLEAGYGRESARVRRILNRSDNTGSPAAELLEAEIALSEDETDLAENALGTIVAENAEPSAEALLKLINTRLGRNAEISYEQAQLAGAYAMEYRGRPLGADLAQAYLSALAASGAFDQAFAELPDILIEAGDRKTEIRSALVGILAKRAEDFDFLRHALNQAGGGPDGLRPATANMAARRLLSLGFVEAAESLVGPAVTGAPARARQLLRAEIALRRSHPRQAELALLGISGEDVDRLRARARSMAGEHSAARSLFAAAGMAEEAQREAWLDRDWETLAKAEDAAKSRIAALKLHREDAPTETESGVLARNAGLIEDSAGIRNAVLRLLEAHPAPDQAD